jgi:hypothetical protein
MSYLQKKKVEVSTTSEAEDGDSDEGEEVVSHA